MTKEDSTIDEMVIHIYSNASLVEQDQSWDIARAIWGPNGQWDKVTANIAESDERATYKTSIKFSSRVE